MATAPTLKTIKQRLGLDDEKAKKLRGLMKREIKTTEFESVRQWAAQCHNPPPWCEKVMVAIDELLGGCGVESVNTEDYSKPHYVSSFWRYTIATYVNMGDTYDTTVIYHTESGRFTIGCWGDIAERLI